jgi:hypothetical protein
MVAIIGGEFKRFRPLIINQALQAGWQGLDIGEIVPLDQIART